MAAELLTRLSRSALLNSSVNALSSPRFRFRGAIAPSPTGRSFSGASLLASIAPLVSPSTSSIRAVIASVKVRRPETRWDTKESGACNRQQSSAFAPRRVIADASHARLCSSLSLVTVLTPGFRPLFSPPVPVGMDRAVAGAVPTVVSCVIYIFLQKKLREYGNQPRADARSIGDLICIATSMQ